MPTYKNELLADQHFSRSGYSEMREKILIFYKKKPLKKSRRSNKKKAGQI